MLHIKSNSEPVIGIDTRTGTSRSLGTLEFVSGKPLYNVDIGDTKPLSFTKNWDKITSSFYGSQVNLDNEVDTTRSLTVMSFVGSNDIILPANTNHPLTYFYDVALNLKRNGEEHNRETDAFSIRLEHEITSSYITPNVPLTRPATIRIPSNGISGETDVEYTFVQTSFVGSGWDYIEFYDKKGTGINRMSIGAPDPFDKYSTDSTWPNINSTPTITYDGVSVYIRDVYIKKVGTDIELGSAKIKFTTSGGWTFKFSDDVAQAYKNLAPGKTLRIRFVFSIAPVAMLGESKPIVSTFLDNKTIARASILESVVYSEDGTRGTFKFNRAAFVSAYINNVQVTDRAQTTSAGEITINFNRNVNEGVNIELRLSTIHPIAETGLYTLTVADTVAPPPAVATLFTTNRIFGNGGSALDTVVAMRDDIEIGRATISANLEYIIELHEDFTLVTGEIIEVYVMDTAGNKSISELYEIDVAETTDGIFRPNLGNDSISSTTTVSRG